MRRVRLTKIIVSLLIVASMSILNPIGASAEWEQDSNGWWNKEGNSWSVGWKQIDGKWYYFNTDGYMVHDTTIDGYTIGSDGAWIESTQNSSVQKVLSNVDSEGKKISDTTGINLNDITKIIFYDGRGGLNKPLTVNDEQKIKEFIGYLGDFSIEKLKDPDVKVGWIHEAEFYIDDNDVMSITFGNPMIINKNYYNVIQGSLETEKIDEFLKSIDSAHKDSR